MGAHSDMTRDCERFAAWLDAYLDGELDPPDRAFMGGHAKSCEACARSLAEARGALALLQSAERVAPSDRLRAAIRVDVTRERDRRERRTRWFRTLAPVLAPACALALLFAMVHRDGQAPAPSREGTSVAMVEPSSGPTATPAPPSEDTAVASAASATAPASAPDAAAEAASAWSRPEASAERRTPATAPRATGPAPSPRTSPTRVQPPEPGPSYVTGRMVARAPAPKATPAPSAPRPVVASVPEPEAVYVATAETRYSL
jgi:hypothetical protein